ncbi:MAG TPA: hypothetical protein PLZ62_02280 [bacterium]|nr:hypothetical protein [bacterium]
MSNEQLLEKLFEDTEKTLFSKEVLKIIKKDETDFEQYANKGVLQKEKADDRLMELFQYFCIAFDAIQNHNKKIFETCYAKIKEKIYI